LSTNKTALKGGGKRRRPGRLPGARRRGVRPTLLRNTPGNDWARTTDL